ncbi:MFS transporter [Nitratireductor mangrovi]
MKAASGREQASSAPNLRWMITALGIAQICSWGSLFYSFPLIAEAMRSDLGWAKPDLYLAVTTGLVLAGIAAFPVGAAIDRGHGRFVMTGASLAAGLLLAAWSQVGSLPAFYLIFAAIGGLQAATLYEPAFAVIARRAGPDGARRGITALTLWGGFASTVFVPFIQLLIDGGGWRQALLVLAGVNIVICATLYFVAIDPEKDRAPASRAVTGVASLSGASAVSRAMRLPVFWALALALVAYAGAFSVLTFHLYPILLEKGLDAAAVVAVIAVIGPAQVAGRVLVWLLMAEAPVRRIGSFIVPIFPLAAAGFAFAPPDFFVLAAIALGYGAANGMITIVRGLAVPEMVDRNAYGAINGALTAPMHLVQAVAPLGAAALWAHDGSYDVVLVVVIAGAVVLAVSFWTAALLASSRTQARDETG